MRKKTILALGLAVLTAPAYFRPMTELEIDTRRMKCPECEGKGFLKLSDYEENGSTEICFMCDGDRYINPKNQYWDLAHKE